MVKQIRFSKELYTKTALLKAAYHFTDQYYIRLDQDEEDYCVQIESRSDDLPDNIELEFGNELLAQVNRELILQNTKSIRELILRRAYASTIVDPSEGPLDKAITPDEQDPSLFKDWYDK